MTNQGFSNPDHTKHQLNVIMGENLKDYWEADVAIEKVTICMTWLFYFCFVSR